jgi:integrase
MSTTKRIKPGIYFRGPYQYQVKIRRNGESVSATFETLAEAEKFHKVQLGKVIAHEFVDTSKERRTSLRSILERYMAEITPTKRGARQEANRLKAWMRTDMAAYSIAAIEPKDIADWIADQKGKAPSTISNSVNLLSAVFKKAREWGYRVDNPCQSVSRPAARPARFAVMSKEDQRLLIQACEQGPAWLAPVVGLALTTGMRQGEIRRLHIDHIHPAWLHLPKTKNGEERDVPLTTEAEAVVAEIRRKLPRRLDGWVFGHPDKLSAEGGFTEWQVQQAYRDAARYAEKHLGVKRRTFHDLRHIALTALAEYHDDVIQLQRTSGHKTLAVLAKYLNETAAETAKKVRAKEARTKAAGGS